MAPSQYQKQCCHEIRITNFLSRTWWRHQMETFSALLAICAGNSPVPGEFPIQRPVTRSFDVIFDLRPNKQLSKQWWGWWFGTQSYPLWRHSNEIHLKIMLFAKCWPFCPWLNVLAHRDLVTHICVSKQSHHWFRHWLVVCSVSSHYLHQRWIIVL